VVAIGLPPLLLPVHLVWLELIIHPVSAIVFQVEPAPPGLMQQPPRSPKAPLLPRGGRAKPWISTFHRLGLRILREEYAAIGYRERFTLFDMRDVEGVIADIARRQLGTNDFDARQLASAISNWKSGLIDPKQALHLVSDPREKAAARCYDEYTKTLRAYNAVDFDDLIALPVALFRNDSGIRFRWQVKLRWLLVDEYQDTNQAQY
jgi:ATP-dependent DNA helicase Rep